MSQESTPLLQTSQPLPATAGLNPDALQAAARVIAAHNARIAEAMRARVTPLQ